MRQFSPVWLLALSLSIGCSHGVQWPMYGQVPAFRLISQDGQTVDSHQLNGQVWVVNVRFTRCPDVCPLTTTLLHMLQSSTADLPQLKLVSISVDPLRDTPEGWRNMAAHSARIESAGCVSRVTLLLSIVSVGRSTWEESTRL